MNGLHRHLGVWLILGVSLFVLFQLMQTGLQQTARISFSEFLAQVEAQRVVEVTLRGNELRGLYKDHSPFLSYAPGDTNLPQELIDRGVRVRAESSSGGDFVLALLNSWLPMLLVIAVFLFLVRQMQSGGGRALSFGRMRTRPEKEDAEKITFKDVAGIEEAKEELREVVEFLRHPRKFERLGGQIPRGILLMGPPGTGKTLLAKAIAGEADVPFFNISGSDFVEMFVGVGASRVRDLFEQGKRNTPCIIFIDEIDAVGRQRGAGLGGAHDEREQTLNQLLVEMDGFKPNSGVIIIASTNRPDVLDVALLRPGRFDRHVQVPLPDIRGREEILKVHARGVTLHKDVSWNTVARGTPGFSGADLANLVNEASLWASRYKRDAVRQEDLEYARDKVLMGRERRSLTVVEEERRITAYHEAGHALAATFLAGVDPLHKVTIVPHGRALGVTQILPEEDRHSHKRSQLLDHIAMMLAGRAAEQIIFGHFSTGASDDIKRATGLVRRMVMEWGMSEEIGPVCLSKPHESVFLGRDLMEHKGYSERTARRVDVEIKGILGASYNRVMRLVRKQRKGLHILAKTLLERETLNGGEVRRLLLEPAK